MGSHAAYSDSPVPVNHSNLPEVVPPEYHPRGQEYKHEQAWPAHHAPTGTQTKRGTKFWVLVTAGIAALIIIVLAAVLGAVASGAIKTAASSPSLAASATTTVTVTAGAPPAGTSGATAGTTTTGPPPARTTIPTSAGGVVVECPAAHNTNVTAAGGKTFRRLCDTNYSGGDGPLGLQDAQVLNMGDCIKLCAQTNGCVGAIFNYQPQCWLKTSILTKSSEQGTEAALLL
jgi:hypothetical protein